MEIGTWQATVPGVKKSLSRLSKFHSLIHYKSHCTEGKIEDQTSYDFV